MKRQPRIESWQWDDDNLAELADHGISWTTVEEVTDENPRFRRNKKRRTAIRQMIGLDSGGTMWTICIKPITYQPGVWRAITGWPSEDHEKTWYKRSL